MTIGKTLRVFLVDGIPNGIVLAEIINWTGQVSRVPKSQLVAYLQRPDSNRTGVYVLTGPDHESPDRLRVYIGESDNIGARLKQHVLDQEKDYWDTAFVISSKDGNITKSHALFLESLIIKNAKDSDRHVVENKRFAMYDNVPESDRSDMLAFNSQIEVLLSVLGLDLFSSVKMPTNKAPIEMLSDETLPSGRHESIARPQTSFMDSAIAVRLDDERHGVYAFGFEVDGKILVKTSSKARQGDTAMISYGALRNRLLSEGILAPEDAGNLVFTRDHLFESPSAASAIILNRNDNGRQSWKVDASSQTLNEFYAEQIAATAQISSNE